MTRAAGWKSMWIQKNFIPNFSLQCNEEQCLSFNRWNSLCCANLFLSFRCSLEWLEKILFKINLSWNFISSFTSICLLMLNLLKASKQMQNFSQLLKATNHFLHFKTFRACYLKINLDDEESLTASSLETGLSIVFKVILVLTLTLLLRFYFSIALSLPMRDLHLKFSFDISNKIIFRVSKTLNNVAKERNNKQLAWSSSRKMKNLSFVITSVCPTNAFLITNVYNSLQRILL